MSRAAEPERELARRWLDEGAKPRGRAETLLHRGFPARAAAEAEAACALGGDAGTLCLAAVARLSAGEPERARAHFEQALARRPASALAWSLKGLLLEAASDPRAARRSLDKAVALRPREAFPWALRAQLWRAAGDLPACLSDLDAALARRREAWLHRLRAECLDKLGRMEEALAEADAALALEPRRPSLHELRGHCLFQRKQYAAAAAAFSRGLSLSPRSPSLLERRADALWLSGRAREAAADLRRCVALEPGSLERRFKLARLLIFGEKPAEGQALLSRLEREGPEAAAGAALLRGFHHFRRRRYLQAAACFETAEGAAREGRFPGRFVDPGYGALARGFEFMTRHSRVKPLSAREPELILTGLGLDYPQHATLEVLKALTSCDIVASNLAGADTMEFLSLFCKDVRTISFEGKRDGAWADRVMSWLKPGRRVAFVTRGHPLVSGHLALMLLKRCKARGVRTRVLSAISSVDQMLSLSEEVLSETWFGLQLLDSQLLLAGRARLDPSLPVILYIAGPAPEKHAASIRRLHQLVAAAYPASHRLFVFGPRYDARTLEPVAVSALGRRLADVEPRMLSSHILLLPPVRALKPA